jgi:hypothetical protein
MKQLRIILPVLLILALASLACGLNLGKTEPASSGEEPVAQTTEASSTEEQKLSIVIAIPSALIGMVPREENPSLAF